MLENMVCDDCRDKGLSEPNNCSKCVELHVAYATSMGKPSPIALYDVSCSYGAHIYALIKLDLYKTWDDVEEWYIKWEVLNYRYKGDPIWKSIPLGGDVEIDDNKRPISVQIYNQDGEEVAEE